MYLQKVDLSKDRENRKVAVYARVSTEHEAQLSALENQKDWYTDILNAHPTWQLTQMYIDKGITGTSAKKRPQFMKMIEDAKLHEFDLVITREVSRFARNTVDTLEYTRQLKKWGVGVYFISDNIYTLDDDGELRLTIMSTLAQDESRKISNRVKYGQQVSMENGVLYGNGNILGYDRVGRNQYVINREQARTVRMIFDMYLDGLGLRAIQFKLEQAGRLTASGKTNWHASSIARILKNAFYCGTLTYHKQWTPDFLEQKKINNIGDMDLLTVEGTHEPIITKEEYEKVQVTFAKRSKEHPEVGANRKRSIGERMPINVWTKIMECECGHGFNRKVWHTVGTVKQYAYQCYSSIRSGTVRTRQNKGLPIEGICTVPMIPEWKLQMMAKHIFHEYLVDITKAIVLAEQILSKHMNDQDETEKESEKTIVRLEKEKEKYVKRLGALIDMRADGELTRDQFGAKKAEIDKALFDIDKELKELIPKNTLPEEEEVDHEDRMKILRFALDEFVNPSDDKDIPEEIIDAFVVKIVVHPDCFDWYLRFSPDDDPNKLNIEGKRQSTAKISSLCSLQHRQRLRSRGNNSRLIRGKALYQAKGKT